jgi:hypothetical protein
MICFKVTRQYLAVRQGVQSGEIEEKKYASSPETGIWLIANTWLYVLWRNLADLPRCNKRKDSKFKLIFRNR